MRVGFIGGLARVAGKDVIGGEVDEENGEAGGVRGEVGGGFDLRGRGVKGSVGETPKGDMRYEV